MHSRIKKLIFFPISCAALFAAGSIVGIVINGHSASMARQEAKRALTLPKIVSKVGKLEVVSAMIVRAGTPDAAVAVEIRNNSDLAVMAVDLSTRDEVNSGGITREGLDDPDKPGIVIEPHGSITMEIGLSEMIPDVPLVISGVTFADGTEDGEEWALELMRKNRARAKAKRENAKKKGNAPQ
ncbi:MAG: hypothetical protein QOG00_3953 [Pyrinomonadaceae bacterium]|nr:hypothetical protein [Pyrinomonadaceae bacterium]